MAETQIQTQDDSILASLLFNSIVTYGPTGVRKTSQIGEFAEYIYEKTGKPTRLYTADGGGYGVIQDYVNAGIIIPWRFSPEKNPLPAIVKASKGAWPKKLVNGINVGGIVIEPDHSKPGAGVEAFKDVGAIAVESWYSIAELLMADVISKGRKISEDVVSMFEEDGIKFGASSRGHYGWAQKTLLGLIRNFAALPVERVLFTSVESKGEDKLTKVLTYGPMAAGSAITAIIPTYVGDCLHFEDFVESGGADPGNPKQNLVRSRVKVWFQQHPDSQSPNIMWPAKSRIVPAKLGEFRAKVGANGYFVLPDAEAGKPVDTHGGLYKYLKAQDELLGASTADKLELKKRLDEKWKKETK
jgi:hypothetical protein